MRFIAELGETSIFLLEGVNITGTSSAEKSKTSIAKHFETEGLETEGLVISLNYLTNRVLIKIAII